MCRRLVVPGSSTTTTVVWRAAAALAIVSSCIVGRVYGCDASAGRATIRFSAGSDRLYVEGGGCIDLAGVMEERPGGPLYHWDKLTNQLSDVYTGNFFLDSSLYVYRNTTLEVVGEAYGGTSNELLLRSDSEKFIQVRAHGGNLLFKGTKVFSWDKGANNYDLNYEDGRSCVQAITEIITNPAEICEGRATGDFGPAHMDVYYSEMGYLGWGYKESYGVSWKARGLCTDLNNLDIFDTIGVTGSITGSELHHNYFGHYSYGHDGGRWTDNHVHNNVGYGFDPHDDSDNLIIHDNDVHDNGWDGIIASKRCNNVSIVGNHVYNNGENGIMLHRSSNYGEIVNNRVHDNGVSGISIHETAYTRVTHNVVEDNRYGIRWNVGSSYTYCAYNTISVGAGNGEITPSYGIYLYMGSDPPEVEGNDGRPKYNYIGYNLLHSIKNEAAKISECDHNVFVHNWVETGQYFGFWGAEDNFVRNNTFVEVATAQGGHYMIDPELPSCFSPGSEVDSGLTSTCA